jgi:hypothetical protein
MEDIYSRNYSAGSSYELDNVIQTLEKMGAVRRKSVIRDGVVTTMLATPVTQKALPWAVKAKPEVKVEGEPGHEDHLNGRRGPTEP